ncbi:hypothetical protein Efla_004189 [Eimeria flavescens]
MAQFATAAPKLLGSNLQLFTEMILQLALIKEKSLSATAALQKRLAPFMSAAAAAAPPHTAAAARELAAAAAAASEAENTHQAVDMNDLRMYFQKLTDLANEEHGDVLSYYSSAVDGVLLKSRREATHAVAAAAGPLRRQPDRPSLHQEIVRRIFFTRAQAAAPQLLPLQQQRQRQRQGVLRFADRLILRSCGARTPCAGVRPGLSSQG